LAGNLFSPELGTVNSSVTPAAPVNKSANVQLFADVLNVATEASFAYAGQQELDSLKKKFSNIAQARMQGGKSSALQAKARAALDEAKANSPWIAKKADSLFQTSFGGGSGGVFEKTPQEKAEEAYQADVSEKAIRLGVSNEEAAKRIAMEENAASAKVLADSQKDVREYNGELVFSNTQVQVNNKSVQLMDAAKRAMKNGGGTISLDDKRSLEFTIDATVAQLKGELASQVRDPNSGHLLIGKAEYDDSLSEIEEWAATSKQLIGDNSYLKVIQDVNSSDQAEIQALATRDYRLIKILNEAGGQATVQDFIAAVNRKEGQAKQSLINRNPILKQAFKQQGSFNQASKTALDKIMVPSDDAFSLVDNEAYALGTVVNDPRNSRLAQTVVEKAATEPQAQKVVGQMVQKNPDSAAIVWSDRYKAWAQANEGKAKRVNETALSGLKKGFLSTYAADNQALPTDFSIGSAPAPTSRLASSKQRAPKPNTITGDGMTPESAVFLRNMLAVYSFNPKELEKVRSESGVSDMTPQEAVPYFVLGKLPERFSNNNSDKPDPQTKPEVDGFTGASVTTDEEVSASGEPDAPAPVGPAMKRFISKAKELNWSESDVDSFVKDLGLADNAQTKSISEQIKNNMRDN